MKTEDLLLIGAALGVGYLVAPKSVKDAVNGAVSGGTTVIERTVESVKETGQNGSGGLLGGLNINLSGLGSLGGDNSILSNLMSAFNKLKDDTSKSVKEATDLVTKGGSWKPEWNVSPTLTVAPGLNVYPRLALSPDLELNPKFNGKTLGEWRDLFLQPRESIFGFGGSSIWNIGLPAGKNTETANAPANQDARLMLTEGMSANRDMASAAPSNIERPITPATPIQSWSNRELSKDFTAYMRSLGPEAGI